MIVLAFDTALDACSVAICEEGRTLAHRHELLSKGHAELLLPMIQSAMAEAALDYKDLDLLAVTVGPGTFTGLRVGLSAARGIALTTGLRVAGVSTLAAIADGAWQSGVADADTPIIVLHDARRQELFYQVLQSRDDLSPPAPATAPIGSVVSIVPPGPVTIIGSGASCVDEEILAQCPEARLPTAPTNPDAVHVAGIGERLARSGLVSDQPPDPLYLRMPDARLPGPAR